MKKAQRLAGIIVLPWSLYSARSSVSALAMQ